MRRIILCSVLVFLLISIFGCNGDKENPVPVLSSLAPTSVAANMPGFTLTLTGSNFVQGSTVNFGGTAKGATFVSSTELQCSISQADIQGLAQSDDPGIGSANLQDTAITVYVTNPSPGGGNSGSITFNVTNNYTFITPTNISNDNYESARTRIGLDTQNNISVVWDQEHVGGVTEIIYTRSTDHGTTWPSQVDISHANTESTYPDLSLGVPGDINVVWQEAMGAQYDIFFGRSADNGSTWSEPLNISKTTLNSTSPAIAVDISGNINVVWSEVVKYGSTFAAYKDCLFFARSTNSGGYFSLPVNLCDTLCKCYPAIAVDSAGRIFVAYRTGGCSAVGEILFILSGDGGLSWSAPKLISTDPEDANLPDFAVGSNGYINLVWQQLVSGYWDIFYSRSTDIGSTWSTPVNISQTSGNSQHPSITVDALGNLNVSWDEGVAGVEEIYQSRSVNNGATWSGNTNISNNAGKSTKPDIAVDSSCNLYFVWLDNTPGSTEIYFIRSVIASLIGY
jgi:hypothetical protein